MNARIPGIPASFGRISWMIASALKARSARGLRRMKMRPEFPDTFGPLGPTLDIRDSTFGSLPMMSAIATWCSFIESKEIPCAASVNVKSSPVSSFGRNPLGM